MKTRWGYDPGSKFLFSLRGEFSFEGTSGSVDSLGDGSDVALAAEPVHSSGWEARVAQELAGCMFLSGWRGNCLALRMGLLDDECYGAAGMLRGRSVTVHGSLGSMPDALPNGCPACLCGPAVKDPGKVAEFCRAFPNSRVYVCPLVDELAAFGALVVAASEEKPRRVNLFVPNKERLNEEFVEFDPKLDGDGYGRMADLVKMGLPVLNEMMSGPGVSPFYGKVITDGLSGASVYVMRPQDADRFFPKEPISAKTYAAMCVPTRMVNTEAFSSKSGWKGKRVDVVVASDMIPELFTFMGFYAVMTGRGFFGTAPAGEVTIIRSKAPVFRSDRAYRVVLNGEGKFDVGRAVQGGRNTG
jgi:hypothetical protein